jgi:hypothetical protein
VNAEERLFTSGDMLGTLRAQQESAHQAVYDWNADQLLATAEADIIEYVVAKYSIPCPVLHRDQIEQLPVSEDTGTARDAFSGMTYQRRVTKIVIAVPFDGEEDVFKLRPSQFGLSTPAAEIRKGELRLSWTSDQGTRADADSEKVRLYFDGQLDRIEQLLGWARADVERYNRDLRVQVRSAVAERRAKLLADRQLETGIGFPVRQRADASQFSVPVSRRKIDAPRRPTASGPFQPEPVLPEAQYEQALAVLRNARNALERTPSMTANLDEEKIRDLLLVLLNAQFEGAAAGEVFNAAGKTDILIRAGDRNVFIAECKIWKSPKTIRDALGQLLSYLTWRDTKAALLLFIRTGEPTTIITKSTAEIEGHANYKRTRDTAEDGERYDFILHANGDPNQEIRLAFLPFALRDTQDQQ